MNVKKKLLALVLVFAMVLSFAMPAFAAKSPANEGYDTASNLDVNTQDHQNKTVTSKISTKSAVVWSVTKTNGANSDYVQLKVARTKENDQKEISHIGDGKKGVFDSQEGRVVKTAVINSAAKQVKILTNAFKGSNVSNLKLQSKKIVIQKDAFKGTKVTNPLIVINGQKKTASSFVFASGAFNGLGKTARICVAGKTMTKAEFQKLIKKLRAAGFTGKIYRKS